MSLKRPLLLFTAATLLFGLADESRAQSGYETPKKFTRQYKINRKADDLLSNNGDTPREARNDRRTRRAQAKKNNRQNESFEEDRTASQEKLGEEKRLGRRQERSSKARSRQSARSVPAVETPGGLND